jgi:hypothetical protein
MGDSSGLHADGLILPLEALRLYSDGWRPGADTRDYIVPDRIACRSWAARRDAHAC